MVAVAQWLLCSQVPRDWEPLYSLKDPLGLNCSCVCVDCSVVLYGQVPGGRLGAGCPHRDVNASGAGAYAISDEAQQWQHQRLTGAAGCRLCVCCAACRATV